MTWQIVFTKQAQKDVKLLSATGLRSKAEQLLTVLSANPYQNPPPYEKLVGDLAGFFSRRINIQHRLVYQIFAEEKLLKSLACGLITNNKTRSNSNRTFH